MAAVTIRNLKDETHRALKIRAKANGRSTEAEIRIILEETVMSKGRIKLGAALRQIGQENGGVDIDFSRSQDPSEPASFE